jgi:hypothetical protein
MNHPQIDLALVIKLVVTTDFPMSPAYRNWGSISHSSQMGQIIFMSEVLQLWFLGAFSYPHANGLPQVSFFAKVRVNR